MKMRKSTGPKSIVVAHLRYLVMDLKCDVVKPLSVYDWLENYFLSLTSIPCKILEHIVLRNLLEKIDTTLNNRQHGFRKGLSCETQICSTMYDILYGIDNQKTVHAAVLDFTKAFDRVPHGLLLQELSQIADVDNYLLYWVHNFLTDRKQRVVLQGCSSDPKPVCSGIPRGSVLGPVLFLVFINDIPECLNYSCAPFANDTLVYQKNSSSKDCKRFQRNLDSLSTWADKWGMLFNISKSKIISFNPKTDISQHKLIGSALDYVDSTT